jgi:hypothetical protein
MTTTKKAALRCIGESYDGRTNRWRITCSCGKDFDPPTTRFSRTVESCPKCGKQWKVNYNQPSIAEGAGGSL